MTSLSSGHLKSWALWATPTVVSGLAMIRFSLFREADYEYALLVTLASALVIPGLSFRLLAQRQSLGTVFIICLTAFLPPGLLAAWSYVAGPRCGGQTALGLFVLMVFPTVLYATAMGVTVRRIFVGATLKKQKLLLAAWVLGHLIVSLARLYFGPAVFVYDHLWGYYPGSLYDELIMITPALLALRGTTVFCVLFLIFFAFGLPRPKRFIFAQFGGCLLFLGIVDTVLGHRTGFRVNVSDIERELCVVRTRGNVTVHLPQETSPEIAEAVLTDHYFRIAQLSDRLKLRPSEHLHSYLYANSAHKARLMGCRNTLIAKPWQKAMHTHQPYPGAEAVAHELVHLALAPYGPWPLKLTSRYLFWPNMGVVEGMAEAFGAPSGLLDTHAEAQALFALGRAEMPSRLLSPDRFWAQAPGRSYPIVGSFFLYLSEQKNGTALLNLYRNGDFKTAFGQPIEELERAWRLYLDERPLSENERLLASDLGAVQSLFCRRCPHQVARYRAELSMASQARRRALWNAICGLEGNSPSCLADKALFFSATGDAFSFAQAIAASDKIEMTLSRQRQIHLLLAKSRARFILGDLFGARGFVEGAMKIEGGPDALRSATLLKILLDVPDSGLTQRYLKGSIEQTLAPPVSFAMMENENSTANALEQFLRGEKDYAHQRFRSAVETLREIHPALPTILDEARVKLLARASLYSGDLNLSEAAFQTACRRVSLTGERARCSDWKERLEFSKTIKQTLGAPGPVAQPPR